MEVYSVTWDPEDHVEELCKMIEGANVADVEKCLMEYVVDYIEPTGWRAVWSPDSVRNPPGSLRLNHPKCPEEDYIVDVRNVSMDRLEAEVIVVHSVAEMKKLAGDDLLKKIPDIDTDVKISVSDAAVESMEVDGKPEERESVREDLLVRSVKKKERKPSTCIIGEVKIPTMRDAQEKYLKTMREEGDAPTLKASDESVKKSKRNLCLGFDKENNDPSASVSPKGCTSTSSCPSAEASEASSLQPSNMACLSSSPEFAVPFPRDQPEWPRRGAVLTVRLWELTPLVQQENDLLDMDTTAEVTEQVRFFYRHIFYPWDPEAEYCCYDEATIAERYQLHQQLVGATPGLPAGVAAEMRKAVREAWGSFSLIQQVEKSSGADREGFELSPETVQQLLWLHQRLEGLKDRFRLLRDPVMRELSTQFRGHELSALSSSLESTVSVLAQCRVWLVGRSCTVLQLQEHLLDLPRLVDQHYPQCSPWSVSLASSLQGALDSSAAGDLVLLLPGVHLLRGMGGLGLGGGAVHGVGEAVVVEGSPETGDVMMHVSVDGGKRRSSGGEPSSSGGLTGFSLRNVTLKPQPDQTAVLVHSCGVMLDGVTVQGECEAGILLTRPTDDLPDADEDGQERCLVTACRLWGCRGAGVEVRGAAALAMDATTIEGCGLGLRLEAPDKVQLTNVSISKCRRSAVEVTVDRGPSAADDQQALLPGHQVLSSLLKECINVTLSGNTKDLQIIHPVIAQEVESPC